MQIAYLTKTDLAHLLHISRRQVDRLMQRGLPYLKLGYRTVRFDAARVVLWLEQHCRLQHAGPVGQFRGGDPQQ